MACATLDTEAAVLNVTVMFRHATLYYHYHPLLSLEWLLF